MRLPKIEGRGLRWSLLRSHSAWHKDSRIDLRTIEWSHNRYLFSICTVIPIYSSFFCIIPPHQLDAICKGVLNAFSFTRLHLCVERYIVSPLVLCRCLLLSSFLFRVKLQPHIWFYGVDSYPVRFRVNTQYKTSTFISLLHILCGGEFIISGFLHSFCLVMWFILPDYNLRSQRLIQM